MNSQIPANMPQPIFQSATEAFLGDSETPTLVRVGQLQENVPILSREEFQKASAIQKQKDAEAETLLRATPAQPKTRVPAQPPPLKPVGARLSGKRSRVPRTTSPPEFDSLGSPVAQLEVFAIESRREQAALADRIAKMEAGQAQLAKGIDAVLVQLDIARKAAQGAGFETREEESKEVDDAAPLVLNDETAHVFDALEPDEDDVDQEAVEDWEPGDPNIARMQAYIQRKTPLKDWRRLWQSVCPRAGFQEWPDAMQRRFTELFGTIILHPKFLTQVRRTVLTFRNGQCAGEEQVYKMLVLLAGSCALYSIITAEV